MTPQEQELITALLNRLKQAGNQPKDADAEALIRRGMVEQPDAPYLLVQTVLIQDMALGNAQNRIADLERQLAAARAAPPPQPTSFLGGAARGSVPSAGPWARSAAPPAPPAPPPPAAAPGSVWTQSGAGPAMGQPMAGQPMTGQPMMGQASGWGMPGAGSGFLRQAATTAAGIAGGALLFEGIQSLFGHHYGNMLAGTPMQPGLSETVINNYYGDQGTPPDTRQADYPADPGYGGDPGVVQADGTPDYGGQDYAQDDLSGQDSSTDQDYASDQDFGGDDGGNFDV